MRATNNITHALQQTSGTSTSAPRELIARAPAATATTRDNEIFHFTALRDGQRAATQEGVDAVEQPALRDHRLSPA